MDTNADRTFLTVEILCTRPRGKEDQPHTRRIAVQELLADTRPQLFCQVCGMEMLLKKGRYAPIRELGSGGFGITYLVRDLDSDGQTLAEKDVLVAKQLRPRRSLLSSEQSKAEELFRRESNALRLLKHMQIPQFLGSYNVMVDADKRYSLNPALDQQQFFYLFQEYIDGENLDVKLRNRFQNGRTFSENEIINILTQLLDVVKFIHAQSKIHRDIKPSNIIQSKDDILHLIDFGSISEVVRDVEEEVPQGTTLIRSPGFSPPEQFRDGKTYYSSDLYALAATCICLLTNRHGDELETLLRGEGWINFVSIHRAVAGILKKMLSYEPSDRFQSAEDVLQALKEIDSSPPSEPIAPLYSPPDPEPVLTAPSRPRGRSNILIGGAAVVGVLAIALSGLIWWRSAQGSKPSTPSVMASSTLASPPVLPPLGRVYYSSFRDVPFQPGEFTYGGSTTWAPIRGGIGQTIAEGIQEIVPGFRVKYTQTPKTADKLSSAGGVGMLIDGSIRFAQISRTLTEAGDRELQMAGITYEKIPVALSYKAIAVHQSIILPTGGLTVEQIQQIYDGKITNWQALGGPDEPIQVITRDADPTNLLQHSLGDIPLAKTRLIRNTPTESLKTLVDTSGTIYINSIPLLLQQCSLGIKILPVINREGKVVSAYDTTGGQNGCYSANVSAFKDGSYPKELSDVLYVLINKNGKIDQQAGEAYVNFLLSDEGQKKLEALGYLGIRSVSSSALR